MPTATQQSSDSWNSHPTGVWHKSLSSFHHFRMLGIALCLIFVINKVCVFDSLNVNIFFQVWNLFCWAVFSEQKDRVIKALGSRDRTLGSNLSSVPHFRRGPGHSLCSSLLPFPHLESGADDSIHQGASDTLMAQVTTWPTFSTLNNCLLSYLRAFST